MRPRCRTGLRTARVSRTGRRPVFGSGTSMARVSFRSPRDGTITHGGGRTTDDSFSPGSWTARPSCLWCTQMARGNGSGVGSELESVALALSDRAERRWDSPSAVSFLIVVGTFVETAYDFWSKPMTCGAFAVAVRGSGLRMMAQALQRKVMPCSTPAGFRRPRFTTTDGTSAQGPGNGTRTTTPTAVTTIRRGSRLRRRHRLSLRRRIKFLNGTEQTAPGIFPGAVFLQAVRPSGRPTVRLTESTAACTACQTRAHRIHRRARSCSGTPDRRADRVASWRGAHTGAHRSSAHPAPRAAT